MKVLVACEESQEVCKAFRERGHEAYSCDIQDCSGGHPEWHIKGDALRLINGGVKFTTCDGVEHEVNGKWDLLRLLRAALDDEGMCSCNISLDESDGNHVSVDIFFREAEASK